MARASLLFVAALALTAGARSVVAQPPATAIRGVGNAGSGKVEASEHTLLDDLAARSETEGLEGTVHGANQRLGTYVFTWWKPGDFFTSVNVSLVPTSPDVATQLTKLERHQQVWVRGRLILSYGSQPHLMVEAVRPGEKWTPGVTAILPAPQPPDLARALSGRHELVGVVHTSSDDGGMLVVEWKDAVIPVQVPEDAALRQKVAGLFREDVVRLRFHVAGHPREPLHLVLDPDTRKHRVPLEVLDSIHAQHDQVRTVEGTLVLFPKSPVIRRSVWGVEERLPGNVMRYFTIYNFTDAKDQAQIDAALQVAWNGHRDTIQDGRNKYLATRVRVRVTGKVNNPARNQANPTLVTTAAQVHVLD